MASKLETDIIAIMEQTRQQIQARMQAQKINASGRTSASIRVEQYDGGVRLVGGYNTTHTVQGSPFQLDAPNTAPIPTLEVGREGGKVPRGFYYIIKEWTREKGLSFANEQERATFAYFVARKIARTGTRRHTSHADVYSTPVMSAKEKIKSVLSQTVRGVLLGRSVTSLKGAFTD